MRKSPYKTGFCEGIGKILLAGDKGKLKVLFFRGNVTDDLFSKILGSQRSPGS
jgi:hypothetical protein